MPETTRLQIIALSYTQLIKYLDANNLLEKELGLHQNDRVVSPDVKEMVETLTFPRLKKAGPEEFVFYTFWIVIDKNINTIVAELGFKGPPNKQGEIEIGYGTMPAFQGKGYMSEAVSAMIPWATERNDVTAVLASVDRNNLASIRIIEKNGFEKYEEEEELLWWRKPVN